jgi:alpha-glucosidase
MYAYLQHLDLAQNFDFVNAEFTIDALRPLVERTVAGMPAGRQAVWFGSNHDHARMATRWARGDVRKHRAALFLLLTLPGVAILYQGDEIALADGRVPKARVLDVGDPPRDPERTPLPWTRRGDEWRDPWLPLVDTSRNVEDAAALLDYTRELIVARRHLGEGYQPLDGPKGIWAYARGDRACVLNMTGRRRRYAGATLDPWEGTIL